jgi:23S rRNA pseudouridine1911/1915/1917 synthase
MDKKKFIVQLEDSKQRIDAFIASKVEGFSKRKAKSLIDQGLITLNNKPLKIASHLVQRGDSVVVIFPNIEVKKFEPFKLTDGDIICDTKDFIVVNKPPGLASQGTKDPRVPHLIPSIEEYFLRKKNTLEQPLILVHRLDRETSGAVFVAKNPKIATWATQQFRDRMVKKRYLALSYGLSKIEIFVENAHLSEIDQKTGNVRVVQSGGKPAQTEFKVLCQNRLAGLTLFECQPKTGRSHQIRVHLDHRGFPILGDKRYGHQRRRLLQGQFHEVEECSHKAHCLHSLELTFNNYFDGNHLSFRASLPEHFNKILSILFPHEKF